MSEWIGMWARALGVTAGVVLAAGSFVVWFGTRSAPRVAWTVLAGAALASACWVWTSLPRTSADTGLALVGAWTVPALLLAAGTAYRAAALVVGAGTSLAVLAYQPFWDPGCLGACAPGDAVLAIDPRAAVLGSAVVAVAGLGLSALELRREPLAVVAAAAGLFWSVLIVTPSSGPARDVLVCSAAVVIVAGVVRRWPSALRAERARAALRRLAAPVDPASGRTELDVLLGRALGDPARTLDAAQVRAVLSPAVVVGINNGVLRAVIAARMRDVEASRLALIEASARERNRLERDLHDGAQQYLVAVLAELALTAPEDAEAARRISDVAERLRRLARGVGTPMLETAGLTEALAALAEMSGTRLVVRGASDLPDRAGRDVYALVAAATVAVDRIGQPRLQVDLARSDCGVVVRMHPGGPLAAPLADLAAALGGTHRLTEQIWEVTLPCA